jgi:hypothetical protein
MEITLILFTFLISFFCLISSIYSFKEINAEHSLRELYSTSSKYTIYYSIPNGYPHNNITGTGDRLKDTVYNALCKGMNCQTQCCEGEINQLYCGTAENCKKYADHQKTILIVTIVCIVVGILILFFFRILFCSKGSKNKSDKCLEGIAILCAILFFPIVIIAMLIKKCMKER